MKLEVLFFKKEKVLINTNFKRVFLNLLILNVRDDLQIADLTSKLSTEYN